MIVNGIRYWRREDIPVVPVEVKDEEPGAERMIDEWIEKHKKVEPEKVVKKKTRAQILKEKSERLHKDKD